MVLNELAWPGCGSASGAEWIELRNTTAVSVPLEGWTLRRAARPGTVALAGTIGAWGHFLLESPDDGAVGLVRADQLYSPPLAAPGGGIELRDADGWLVDSAQVATSPPARPDTTLARLHPDLPGVWTSSWIAGPPGGIPVNGASQSPTFPPAGATAHFTSSPAGAAETEAAILADIGQATTTIDAALYSLDAAAVVQGLVAAHQRGVRLRVVCEEERCGDGFDALRAAGIAVIPDQRSGLMHDKFMVVDADTLWTGSLNMTDAGFGDQDNDAVRITSAQLAWLYVVELTEMFDAQRFGTAKTSNTPHRLFLGADLWESRFSPTDGAEEALIAAVRGARKSIRFAIYDFTSEALADAVIGRLSAGVPAYGVWDQSRARLPYSQALRLCQAGATTRLTIDPGRLLHHKFMLIDADGSDPVLAFGSYNWTDAGARSNDEDLLIVHGSALGAPFLGEWQRLFGAAADLACPPPTPAPTATPTPGPTATVTLSPTPTATEPRCLGAFLPIVGRDR